MKDLIPLQNAHVTQLTDSTGQKTAWSVQENETDEVLFELPVNLSENVVFAILKFARQYELKALNVGIQFSKKTEQNKFDTERQKLLRVISELEQSNGKLATKVHKFLETGE